MSIPLSAIDHKNVAVLRVLDALLGVRAHTHKDRDRDRIDVEVDVLGLRLHLQTYGHVISEARIDMADDESSALKALRWHLGPDTEMATTHRRVHRWLVDGREVVLDSFNSKRTCLRVT